MSDKECKLEITLKNNSDNSSSIDKKFHFQASLRSLEMSSINYLKKHNDYKSEKINQLEVDFNKLMDEMECEKALITMKRLIFFHPNSKFCYFNNKIQNIM
jgi:hypothetical protein